VARAVVESIEAGRGDVLTVMMARQMGKNQLSAALEHYLLHRFAAAGGQIVKCSSEVSLGYRPSRCPAATHTALAGWCPRGDRT
jgi:hypothetical protein